MYRIMLRVENFCIATANTEAEALQDWQQLTEERGVLTSFLVHFELPPTVYAPFTSKEEASNVNHEQSFPYSFSVVLEDLHPNSISIATTSSGSSSGGGSGSSKSLEQDEEQPRMVRLIQRQSVPRPSPAIGGDSVSDSMSQHSTSSMKFLYF